MGGGGGGLGGMLGGMGMGSILGPMGASLGGLAGGLGIGMPKFTMGSPTQGQVQYPAADLFPTASAVGKGLPGQISAWQQQQQPFINQALQSAMPGSQQYQDLWNMTSRNYMNQLTPKLSGAGLLTSGPGINAMQQGMGDLSTQFAQMQQGDLLRALQTTGQLQQMPIQAQTQLMNAILGQRGMQDPSLFQQMGGMQGLGSLGGMLGGLGGFGSLFGGGGAAAAGGVGGAGAADLIGSAALLA